MNAWEECTAVTVQAEVCTAKLHLQHADRLTGKLSLSILPQFRLPQLTFLCILANSAKAAL
jgi:hypothetical protein